MLSACLLEFPEWVTGFGGALIAGLLTLFGSLIAIKAQFREQERVQDLNARAFFLQIVEEQVRCIDRLLATKHELFNYGTAAIARRTFEENKSLFLENYVQLARIREKETRDSLVDGFRMSAEWIYVAEVNLQMLNEQNGIIVSSTAESPNYLAATTEIARVNSEFAEMFDELSRMKARFENARSVLARL